MATPLGTVLSRPAEAVLEIFPVPRIAQFKEGLDLALRLGPLADSSATVRLIGRTHRLLAAGS